MFDRAGELPRHPFLELVPRGVQRSHGQVKLRVGLGGDAKRQRGYLNNSMQGQSRMRMCTGVAQVSCRVWFNMQVRRCKRDAGIRWELAALVQEELQV